MKSKTLIEKQMKRKTNSELVETILLAKKNEKWLNIAGVLSGPRKNRKNANLNEINQNVKEGEKILISGKVLSQGNLDKKIKIIASSFSENAKEKIKKAGSESITMLEEIKSNPGAKGIKILGSW